MSLVDLGRASMKRTGHTKPKGRGKRRYRTRLDAEIVAAEVHAHGKDGRPYFCPRCGGWHLSGQPKGSRP